MERLAGIREPFRLPRDGQVAFGIAIWDAEHEATGGTDTELLNEVSCLLKGRFPLTPRTTACRRGAGGSAMPRWRAAGWRAGGK
jgi:hypothetical protein